MRQRVDDSGNALSPATGEDNSRFSVFLGFSRRPGLHMPEMEIHEVMTLLTKIPEARLPRIAWAPVCTLVTVMLLAATNAWHAPAAIAAAPGATTESVAGIFERVRSSVVTVQTLSRGAPSLTVGTPTASLGLGSGVVISEDGQIMTAAHVVHTADAVEVTFIDGTRASAKVLSSDPLADVALLRVVGPLPDSVTPAVLGDSDTVRVGDRLLVVGAPFGATHTLTVGHLSARRSVSKELYGMVELELLQTDAAINTGNSGGPMFYAKGQVVGIVSHILSRSGGSEGLGFAVSSAVARRLLLERPPIWGGLSGIAVHDDLARALNTPDGQSGYLVQRVARRSLAAQLGLKEGHVQANIGGRDLVLGGDIILSVDGIRMGAPDALQRVRAHLLGLPPGSAFEVRVLRGGRISELTGSLPKSE